MRIALLSCTSSKKSYKCKASEMYSESPRFTLAYKYAKMASDEVYILSAKYGLISEDLEIEPYNETLKDKSTIERKEWSRKVVSELNRLFSLENDEFLVLAGVAYNEYILPHLKKYDLPLRGESLGNWIPKLRTLIEYQKSGKEHTDCDEIHRVFNNMQRMRYTDIKELSFKNGIYIMFEIGEKYFDMDRVVRVGTHRADNRLKKRLKDHFIRENKDSSIFRKNIGRAILHSKADSYETIWELNTSNPEIRLKYANIINPEYQVKIEKEVTAYLQENFSFVCFEVDTKEERLKLEEGLISSLNQASSFKSSSSWFGLNSPNRDIANSGLWNKQGLRGIPLNAEDINRIKALVSKENYNPEYIIKTPVLRKSKPSVKVVNNTGKVSTQDIRNYIKVKLETARENGLSYCDVISGDIHREMNLDNKMPSVCGAMYKLKSEKDEILHTTPSGKSSTIKIRYYLNEC